MQAKKLEEGVPFDERAWLGDPGSAVRRRRVPGSEAAIAARTKGVRPFPMAAAKVLSLTGGTEFDPVAIVREIESDVALAARVLRLVNSSAFALRSRVSSLHTAVVMLGSSGVREAVVAGAVLNMFPGKTTDAWSALQSHAMMTATLARHLAPEWRLPGDEMFTAAFLHDIGKWILLEQEEDYASVLEQFGGMPEGTLDEERGRYGFDHAELTEHLLHHWAFPKSITRVVGLHHDPAEGYQDSLAPRIALLRFANLLAHAIARGERPDANALSRVEPMAYLELSPQWLDERFDALTVVARGNKHDSDGPAPLSGDRPMVTLSTEDAQPETACAYCDQPSFGVHCRRCDALLCTQHSAMENPTVCTGCARELETQWASQGVGDARLAFKTMGVGAVLLLGAAILHGWFVLLVVPAGALLAYGWALLRKRARMLREFVEGR